MNKKERELEELVNDLNCTKPVSIPPVFEMYVTLFSILIAIMFFIYPSMLMNAPGQPELYKYMTGIMPQAWWAFSFFTACMLKAIGLMFNNDSMRIIGLIASSALYILLAVCYAFSFPSIGSVTFTCMALFTLISIPIVKHTSIKHKER